MSVRLYNVQDEVTLTRWLARRGRFVHASTAIRALAGWARGPGHEFWVEASSKLNIESRARRRLRRSVAATEGSKKKRT